MNEETKKLLRHIKAYRDDMVARNYPYQEISDIITEWEKNHKDLREEADKENKKLKAHTELQKKHKKVGSRKK